MKDNNSFEQLQGCTVHGDTGFITKPNGDVIGKAEWVWVLKSTFPQYQSNVYKCPKCGYEVTCKYTFCPDCGK